MAKEKTPNKSSKPRRETFLIRLDRSLKGAVERESERTQETMSRIMDWAVRDYLKSIEPLDNR